MGRCRFGVDGERSVCREELWVVRSATAFDRDERVEKRSQALRRRYRKRGDRTERRHGFFRPPADDEVAQFGFRCDMPIDGRMAHTERPRHIHDRRLRGSETTDDFFGGGEDSLAGERDVAGRQLLLHRGRRYCDGVELRKGFRRENQCGSG